MEHLKLFSTRLNVPQLIRVCEELELWRELTFLYVAYDEYDNALGVMITHSPLAWEHVQVRRMLRMLRTLRPAELVVVRLPAVCASCIMQGACIGAHRGGQAWAELCLHIWG